MKKRNVWLVIIATVFLTLFFIYSNIEWVKKGDIMEGSILNDQDSIKIMNEYVRSMSPRMKEMIPFVLTFDKGIKTKEDIQRIAKFHQKVRDFFPKDFEVHSMASYTNYRIVRKNDEEIIFSSKYSDTKNFNIDTWKKQIISDEGVYGGLIGKNFDFATVLLLLPEKYDEIQTGRKVIEFLEQRNISKVEWLLKSDIHPTFQNVFVGGWLMARVLIDGALNSDVLRLISIGLLLSFLLFWKSTNSLKQAFISTFIIIISILWTRGSIGLLGGIGFYERVYVLLVYTTVIVMGVSFTFHLFSSYNETGDWKIAKERIKKPLFLTMWISVFGFLTLWYFYVLSIRELGVLSALGGIFLALLSWYLLPAMSILMKVKKQPIKKGWLDKFYLLSVGICQKLTIFLSKKMMSSVVVLLLLFTTILGTYFFFSGKLTIGSRPLEYINGTYIYKSAEYMNADGRPGFDFLEFFVEYDKENPKKLLEIVKKIEKIEGVRETSSSIKTIQHLSMEEFEKEFPETDDEMKYLIQIMESNTDKSILNQFQNLKGFRISISNKADSSIVLGELANKIISLNKDKNSARIYSFGKSVSFPRIDHYITLGKPLNVVSSQILVIIFSALWIYFSNKKAKLKNLKTKLSPVKTGLLMSIPFLFASGGIIIVMTLTKVALDISTSAIGAIAIAASIDFSLYIAYFYNEAIIDGKNHLEAIKETLLGEGKIVMGDIVLNMILFSPLLISSFPPVRSLGWMMLVMLFLSGVGSLILMPPLLRWAVRK